MIPWFLIGDDEWPDMEGPQVLEVVEADNPCGLAVGRLVVFHEEDYMERAPDGWNYIGLLPLIPVRQEREGGGDDEDNDEAPDWSLIPDSGSGDNDREEEQGSCAVMDALSQQSYEWPESIPCPVCPGEAVQVDVGCGSIVNYLCDDCEASIAAASREQILNAAVLMILEASLTQD